MRLAVTPIDRLLVKAKPRATRRAAHVKSGTVDTGKISALFGADEFWVKWSCGVTNNKTSVRATNAAN